ncbi:DUF3159 domain-containing protein [Saccharopolyspora oryzae]|uniref:DUF3159 domain-containing protein n=1 Tax=Saccharopolyspora oryzae TaxID=2997343 RepID=A0ABT4UUI8_9PSEU|nr:DUF3159 domain-containing protein [Saccharopolyspora oryzae]MDA3625392.1 DUF3159 domain-containing protein [Saccharopolyspora oryzae]
MSERDSAAAGLSAQDAAEKQSDTGEQQAAGAENTLLEQMGGVSGLAYSAVPIVVFVVVSSFTSLMPAIWSAIGVAVAIAIFRLVRKEPLQPAISGVIGVAVCSFIAYRSGDAKGFFLLGIWTSLIYGGLFLVSVLARWPLVGVAWSALNGLGFAWRKQKRALRGYDLATLAWVAVFAAKYVVQQWLYDADQTGWLAFARIAMGYPLTGLALIVTVWAIRRAAKVAEQEKTDAEETPAIRSNPSLS